jgi:hypothetical protein
MTAFAGKARVSCPITSVEVTTYRRETIRSISSVKSNDAWILRAMRVNRLLHAFLPLNAVLREGASVRNAVR